MRLVLHTIFFLSTFFVGTSVLGQEVGLYKTYEDYLQGKITDVGESAGRGVKTATFNKDGIKSKYGSADCWGYAFKWGGKIEDFRFVDSKRAYAIIIHAKNDKQIAWYAAFNTSIIRDDSGEIQSLFSSDGFITTLISKGGNGKYVSFKDERLLEMMADQPKLVEEYKKELKEDRKNVDFVNRCFKYIQLYNKASE